MSFSIGLIGLIGSGKDTFGDMLLERLSELDSRFQVDNYARPLKQLAAEVLEIEFITIDDRSNKEKEFKFEYTERVEDLLYNFMDIELGFVGIELSEGLRKVRSIFSNLTTLSPRSFYQKFGTDTVRKTRNDAFVKKLHDDHKYHPVLVRDVRFINELCDVNIIVCRHEGVARPSHESEQLAWDLQFSEATIDPYLLRVNNKEDLSSLQNKVQGVVDFLILKEFIYDS